MQNSSAPLISKVPSGTSMLRKTFSFDIGNVHLKPEYWQAITIVVLLFLIVWTVARWRHLYVKWNLQGFLPSIALGFILTLLVEGFFLISGRTMLTELLGWENAPKPISTALDEGRARLVEVLGTSAEIPSADAKTYSSEEVIRIYSELSDEDSVKVQSFICTPSNDQSDILQ